MSNGSIISRLENKFEEYEGKIISKYDFTDYLVSSIEALEGLDYDIIQTAKDFQYKFEVAEFKDEDPKIESFEKVKNDFIKWLGTLKIKITANHT